MAIKIRILAAVAAGMITIAACTPSDTGTQGGQPDGLHPITLGLTYIPNVQFAPFYLAASQGYFEDEGLEVTLRHHGESEDVFGALLDGTEDAVVSGGTEVLQARASGQDVVSVATLYQTYPVSLVVPADSPITSPEDLAGHSLGIPGPFGDSYLGMLAMFEEYDLSEDTVQVQSIGFTGQHALSSGSVDAIMAFSNNEPVLLEAAGFATRTLTWENIPLIGSGIATRDEIRTDSNTHSGTSSAHIAAMLRAIGQAIADLQVDPQLGVRAAAEYIPGTVDEESQILMEKVLHATIDLYAPPGEPWGNSDISAWEEMIEFMENSAIINEGVSVDDVVTNDLLTTQ